MTPTEVADENLGPTLSSGPIVWAATIVFTTLLLALLGHVLWLVVPSLLAIVVYYALFPLVRRLTLAGVQRPTAAAIVAGLVFVGAGSPWCRPCRGPPRTQEPARSCSTGISTGGGCSSTAW